LSASQTANLYSVGGLTATEIGQTTNLCSVGGMTTREVGLTASICSTQNRLINDYKWILLVRSMAPVRGHAYKRH
jgi:hypothetical protein